MKIKMILTASILVVLTFVMGIMGCGQNNNIDTPIPGVSRISITPEETTLAPNGSQQFNLSYYDQNNNIVTNESAAISWSVSGSVGTITQNGTFAATAVGNGQVVARAGSLSCSSNIAVVDGTPPDDFDLIVSSYEVFASNQECLISWHHSSSKDGLKMYQILGCNVDQNETTFGVLKNVIDPSSTSTFVNLLLDENWKIKVRAVDNNGLWSDSDGTSAAGDKGDSARILRVKVDLTPPLFFEASNFYSYPSSDGKFRGVFFDNPKEPIRWNIAQDKNLDRYEIAICTDPDNLSSTTVFAKTVEAGTISCEVSLPTGFYFANIVAYDKAGHYRTITGKTDIPDFDKDLSSGWAYSLPIFGINGSTLNYVTKWGSEGSGEAQFKWPSGLAVDKNNYIYVVDSGNNRIEKFDSNGSFIASWGSFGTGEGQFLDKPTWIAIDNGPYNNIYVADNGGYIYIFSNVGTFIHRWLAAAPGILWGIAVDNAGVFPNIYVTDTANHDVKKFSFSGKLLAKWGSEGVGDGQFDFPAGIAVDSNGNVFVADAVLARIQKFNNSGDFLTKWDTSPQKLGWLSGPRGVKIDNEGNIWVADISVIKKFDNNGNLKLKYGHFGMSGPDDDLFFSQAQDVAVDGNGNVYVTENQKHRVQKFRE